MIRTETASTSAKPPSFRSCRAARMCSFVGSDGVARDPSRGVSAHATPVKVPHVSEQEPIIDETGRNPTQRRMDEEGTDERPVDAEWGPGETEDEEAPDVPPV